MLAIPVTTELPGGEPSAQVEWLRRQAARLSPTQLEVPCTDVMVRSFDLHHPLRLVGMELTLLYFHEGDQEAIFRATPVQGVQVWTRLFAGRHKPPIERPFYFLCVDCKTPAPQQAGAFLSKLVSGDVDFPADGDEEARLAFFTALFDS